MLHTSLMAVESGNKSSVSTVPPGKSLCALGKLQSSRVPPEGVNDKPVLNVCFFLPRKMPNYNSLDGTQMRKHYVCGK